MFFQRNFCPLHLLASKWARIRAVTGRGAAAAAIRRAGRAAGGSPGCRAPTPRPGGRTSWGASSAAGEALYLSLLPTGFLFHQGASAVYPFSATLLSHASSVHRPLRHRQSLPATENPAPTASRKSSEGSPVKIVGAALPATERVPMGKRELGEYEWEHCTFL